MKHQHISGSLWGESTGDQWFPSQRISNMERPSMSHEYVMSPRRCYDHSPGILLSMSNYINTFEDRVGADEKSTGTAIFRWLDRYERIPLPVFTMKTPSFWYRYHKPETVVRPSYVGIGNSYNRKMVYFGGLDAQVSCAYNGRHGNISYLMIMQLMSTMYMM